MTLLSKRFSLLSALPHVPLADLTPTERLDRLSDELASELWIKRDDQNTRVYGGNKVRKLEFLLGDARRRGARALVTTGAFGSHHVLATSLFGARWGLGVTAIVMPQPWTRHVEENLRCSLGAGTWVHPVKSWPAVLASSAKTMATLTARGRKPYWIPHGGSSVVGALGFVEAGLELVTQIDAGDVPEPDAIFVALGSGGTAAGLAVGLAAAGLTTEVIGVRVTPKIACNRGTLNTLVHGMVRHLRKVDPSFPEVARGATRCLQIESGFYGRGYGEPDAQTEGAVRRARRSGLELDGTYTGKAFAAFVRAAGSDRKGETLMFWNTLNSVDLSDQIANAPPVPPEFRALVG